MVSVNQQDYKPLAPGGVFLVGQDQDITEGAFDENQAFSGNVTQVEMWNGLLGVSTIKAIANCTVEDGSQGTRVVSWGNVENGWSSLENVDVNFTDTELSSICQQSYPVHKKMFIFEKISYDYAKLSCDQVGGEIPVAGNNEMIKSVQSEYKERLQATAASKEYSRCTTEDGNIQFWLGQYRNDTTADTWHNPYDPQMTFENFDVPHTTSNCVYLLGDDILDAFQVGCTESVACGICDINKNENSDAKPRTYIKMKGICGDDLWQKKIYDLNYYVHGVKNGRPHFRLVWPETNLVSSHPMFKWVKYCLVIQF